MAISLRGTPQHNSITSSSTSWPVTLPTGVQSGDVILIGLLADWQNTPTVTAPTGFTKLGQANAISTNNLLVYRKVSDGTEGSSVTFTLSAVAAGQACALAYSGVSNSTPEDVATTTNTITGTTATPSQTSQTTVTDLAKIVAFFGRRGDAGLSGAPGGGATEQIDSDDVNNYYLYVEDLSKTPAGAVALSMTLSPAGHDFWNMVQVALRPAAAATFTPKILGYSVQ